MAGQQFKVGDKLAHVKAPNFINEHVDRFSLTSMLNGKEKNLVITMGRDVIEVIDEVVSDKGLEPHQEGFEIFRRNVATITIPGNIARGLAAAILRQLDLSEAQSSDAAEQDKTNE